MFDKTDFKDLTAIVLILCLIILTWLIIKPLTIAIISGLLLAYVLFPFYEWVLKKVKNEFSSALLVCLALLLLFVGLAGIIISTLLDQAIALYLSLQGLDLSAILLKTLPTILSTEISSTLVGSVNTFISNSLAYALSSFNSFILNIPTIALKIFVAAFVFFFVLKDGKKAIEYIKSLDILEKENQEKFFIQFKNVTYSVLVGQVVVGIIQGMVAGAGYFVFRVPNALLLTLFTMFVAIIPFIGAWIGWVPVVIYLFAIGRTEAGLGLLIYGLLVVSLIDNVLRTIIVSKKTKINSAIVIVGMIGGLFAFGVLGLIIGPLVLAYILLVIEIYRKRGFKSSEVVFKEAS
ncbi:MAG: AI-2E family transporter [Candidatus Pacearchaeota archaeon]|jgi:predicted PurR-regulated permease PerM